MEVAQSSLRGNDTNVTHKPMQEKINHTQLSFWLGDVANQRDKNSFISS